MAAGAAMTLLAIVLHLEFFRHAGPLWRDEINSLHVASSSSLVDVWRHSRFDSFPIAWVVVLHAWVSLVGSTADTWLRGLGLGIGFGTLAAVWWTARRMHSDAPVVALLLLAMSPTAIIYGDQVRGYGLGTLAIVLALGAMWRLASAPSLRSYGWAQAAAILAVQTYYGNCFLLLAICTAAALVAWYEQSWRRAWAPLAAGAVAALSLAVNWDALTYASSLSGIEQATWGLQWWATVFLDSLGAGIPLLTWAWAAAPVLAMIGLAFAWRVPQRRGLVIFCLVAAAAGLLGYAAYVSFIRVRTQFWYYLPLMAVIAVICEVGTAQLAQRLRHGAALRAAAALAIAALVFPSLLSTVRLRMTNVDVVAEVLSRDARGDDLIVIVPYYLGVSFARYFDGATPWMTIPDFEQHTFHLHAAVGDKMRVGGEAVRDDLRRVEQTLRRGSRVWVVGAPPNPPPGAAVVPLPPAGATPTSSGPYFDNWEQQLAALLLTHAGRVDPVTVPDVGAINRWEGAPLFRAEGWR